MDGMIYTLVFVEKFMTFEPGEIKLVPTGIASAFSSKYRMSVGERGSTGTRGLAVRAGKIDSGYRGEWFIAIQNNTQLHLTIAKKRLSCFLEWVWCILMRRL